MSDQRLKGRLAVWEDGRAYVDVGDSRLPIADQKMLERIIVNIVIMSSTELVLDCDAEMACDVVDGEIAQIDWIIIRTPLIDYHVRANPRPT